MVQPVNQLRAYLEHPWRFHRHIVHHDTGQVADIHGTVSWQEMSQPEAIFMLQYCETGVIQVGTYTGKASQTHWYTFPTAATVDIYFSDKRFFYTLDLTTGRCDIRHPCGDDTYDGACEALSDTTYQQIWRVTGPRKNYTSHTSYTR